MPGEDPQPHPSTRTDTNDRDRALIAGIREGNTVALSGLLRLYVVDLVELAYGVVRREDLADDVVQDVFVRLWDKRADIKIEGNVASYLRKAVRNAAINVVRQEQALHRAHGVVGESYITAPPAVTNSGANKLAANDIQIVVQRTLEEMPPQVREIFLMRRFKEMELDEIASALGISVQTVKSQMSRALKRLAEALKDWS